MLGKFIDILSKAAAVFACAILVAMTMMILYEIILRTFFASSTYVLDEFVGYGVAVMTFMSFALALRDGVFIRVNLVTANVGPKVRRILEVGSCAVGTVLFTFLGYFILKLVMRNFENGVVSNSLAETPLWIPQGFVFLGVALLVLQFAALTVRFSLGEPIIDKHEEL
ncbi:MAG: C4-dicarboxylate ABC transporter permease [Sneathiella sp.]|nr:MAG: C4-dicarboxylate ABC transporter permease [Sneathiella sp.]